MKSSTIGSANHGRGQIPWIIWRYIIADELVPASSPTQRPRAHHLPPLPAKSISLWAMFRHTPSLDRKWILTGRLLGKEKVEKDKIVCRYSLARLNASMIKKKKEKRRRRRKTRRRRNGGDRSTGLSVFVHSLAICYRNINLKRQHLWTNKRGLLVKKGSSVIAIFGTGTLGSPLSTGVFPDSGGVHPDR